MHSTRRLLQHLPLLAFALLGTSLFTACSESHRLPTEPEPLVTQASVTSQASAEGTGPREVRGFRQGAASDRAPLLERGALAAEPGARIQARTAQPGDGLAFEEAKGGNDKGGKGGGKGGNGGNGGNGGGGNGGGGNGGGGKPRGLSADVQPDVWNTNWEHSAGTVSVVIRGSELDQIDADSLVLEGSAGELEPLRVQSNKNQIRAFFAKSDAIALLDTPERGEKHELKIEFTVGEGADAETRSLTLRVRIVGPGGGGGEEEDLELQVQPDTWNTNWARSAGTVSVKITGDGLADVDLDSIVLVGTDPAAAPLPALRASRNGNHIRAFFAKRDAIETLDTPTAGERHEIVISLDVAGAETELKDTIRVVGPGN
jgi:hypothetical protein